MILEVSVVLTLLGLFWVLGRVLLLTCGAQEHDWLAAPLGLCLVGLGANALYFGLNLPVHVIRGALGVVAVMCAVLLIRARLSRQVWGHLLVLVAVFLVLALPAALSGPQYYVFRGNHWDQFNYINQTLAVWANPASEYQHMAPTNFLDRDVLAYGVKWINLRPAVALTAALVMPGTGNLHLLAFLYVTALWALAFPAVAFAWRELLDVHGVTAPGRALVVAPALAFVFGFWGQYVFDLNAWSQMASLSLSVATVFAYLRLLRCLGAPGAGRTSAVGEYVVTATLSSGMFLFYPESAVLHAAFLGAASVAWFVVARRMPGVAAAASLALLPVITVLLSSLPNWEATIGLLQTQLAFQNAQAPEWWRYFDNYWRGIHGAATGRLEWPSTVLNLSLALQGLFFVTPIYATPRLVRWGWILAAATLSAGSYLSLARGLLGQVLRNPATAYLTTIVAVGTAFLLHLVSRNQLWAFGKALSYLSPYLFLVLCLGLARAVRKTGADSPTPVHREWATAAFAVVYLVLQLGFGGLRFWVARDPSGIGYDSATYPSVQAAGLKVDHAWALTPVPYLGCRAVGISVGEVPVERREAVDFQVQQLKQVLFYNGVRYYDSRPIRWHFAVGEPLGTAPPVVTDCTAELGKLASGQWAFMPRRHGR